MQDAAERAEGAPDLRQALSSCYRCEAVPRFACTNCGRLFCERHGGRRLVYEAGGLRRRVVCDECTPDQARMRRRLALFIALFLSVAVFIGAVAVAVFLGWELPGRPPIDRPVPVPVDPRLGLFGRPFETAGKTLAGMRLESGWNPACHFSAGGWREAITRRPYEGRVPSRSDTMTGALIEAINDLLGPAAVVVFLILAVQSPVLPFAFPPLLGAALAAFYALVGIDLFLQTEHPVFIAYALGMAVIAVLRGRRGARRGQGGRQVEDEPASGGGEEGRPRAPADGVPVRRTGEPTRFEHRLRQLREAGSRLEPQADYRRLSSAELRLPAEVEDRFTVYAATEHPARYLAIPPTYVVARTRDEAAPALSMTAVLDPERPDGSVVTFEAGVAPDILPFHLALLLDHLRQHAAEAGGEPDAVELHLPSDLEEPPTVSWQGPMTRLDAVVPDGEALILRITARSMGKAAAVMERLRPGPQHHGLAATVRFALGREQTATASLFINLGRTTGESLTADLLEDGKVEIRNRTESELVVRNLLFVWPDDRRPALQRVVPERRIAAADGAIFDRPEGIERVHVDYHVEPLETKTLPELRIDVGEVDIRLAVETDIQPTERFPPSPGHDPEPLREIVVDVRRDHLSPKKAVLRRDAHRFVPAAVVLGVPLDRYLAPEHRVIRYRTSYVFAKGARLDADEEEMNYTEPRLTVTRQALHALLRDGS